MGQGIKTELRGPRTEPWGTPHTMPAWSIIALSIRRSTCLRTDIYYNKYQMHHHNGIPTCFPNTVINSVKCVNLKSDK